MEVESALYITAWKILSLFLCLIWAGEKQDQIIVLMRPLVTVGALLCVFAVLDMMASLWHERESLFRPFSVTGLLFILYAFLDRSAFAGPARNSRRLRLYAYAGALVVLSLFVYVLWQQENLMIWGHDRWLAQP